MNEIKQGYRPDEYSPKDHIFGSGATPDPIILLSGNWRKATPILEEFQATRGFENYGCVTFTELSAVEKLAKLVFGENWNKSERFTYIASDTDPANNGNSPRAVADSIRKTGVIDEKDLPFDDSINTLEKFNSPKPLTDNLIKKGEQFLNDYKFGYDTLTNVSRDGLREMLKRSPVAIAVHAWTEMDGVYIRPNGAGDTHLTLLENVKDNGELEVFDSYPPANKTLSKDFPIYSAMRFYIRKKTEEEKLAEIKTQLTFIGKILELIKKLLPFLVKKTQVEIKTLDEITVPEIIKKDLLWDTSQNARHSVRVLCDEMGLSVVDKNLITQVISCESGFNIHAKNENKDKNGKVTSIDYGIIQANSYWYIGEGKPIPSIEVALNDPEFCVRVMIQMFKKGRLKDWVCFSTGKYLNYPSKLGGTNGKTTT